MCAARSIPVPLCSCLYHLLPTQMAAASTTAAAALVSAVAAALLTVLGLPQGEQGVPPEAQELAAAEAGAAAGQLAVGQEWWSSRGVEVPLDNIDFDVDLTQGQLRTLNATRVAATIASLRRSMPGAPLPATLVAKDHTGVSFPAHMRRTAPSFSLQARRFTSWVASTPSGL